MRLILMSIFVLSIQSVYALAQQAPAPAQSDAAKMAPYYQQQRNLAYDNVAQCAEALQELRARVAELEKQLSEASNKPK